MTRKMPTDPERVTGLREVIEAANGDWQQATALWSVQADLDWLLSRAVWADEALADARATIEAMSTDAADLHDLMDEAALLRTALAHVLVRTHDSGCGTCDAARALLTANHEFPSSRAALSAREAFAQRERDRAGEAR